MKDSNKLEDTHSTSQSKGISPGQATRKQDLVRTQIQACKATEDTAYLLVVHQILADTNYPIILKQPSVILL